MAVIEYGPDRPHAGGFIGLRVYVKKVGGKPFQKYFPFKGLSDAQIAEVRSEADRLDQEHTEGAKVRLASYRLYQPSRSPLSSVLGISVGLVSRHHENGGFRHELVVTVAGVDQSVDKAGSFSRQTKSITIYDYEWFIKAWRKACKDKAEISGLRRTPSRWYQSVPSEKDVQKFISDKVVAKQKAALLFDILPD